MSLSTILQRVFGMLFLVTGVMIAQVPTITSFSPTSAAFNSAVTITGTNFSTTPANNIVMIGNLRATVTSASATSLTVTVPRGASVGKVSVTTGGLSAYSALYFTTAFTSTGLTTTTFVDTSKLGYYGKSISVGDMDGDGLADIISLTSNSGVINISRNTGVAGPLSYAMFASAVSLSGPTTSANDVAIGDLDGDGKLDIVVVSQTGDANPSTQYMSIFRNTSTAGSLSFETRVDYSSGTYPNSVSIADADGDGKPDIVTTYSGVSAIYRNTHSSGSFTAGSFAARVTFGSLSSTKDAVLSDMNGDKKPELIVVSSGGTMSAMKLTIYNNTSTSGTLAFDTGVDFLTLQSPRNISVGDFDFNGKPDIMVVAQYGVALFDNQISGTITTSSFVQTTLSTSSDLSEGAVADFDGDGKQDFMYGFSSNGSHFRIFKNIHTSGALAAGSFSAVSQSFSYSGNPSSMAVADFDRDGRPDFVNNSGSILMVYRNKANVAEFSPASYSVSLGTVPVGTIKTSTITVSNPGSANLSVTSAASTNGEYTVSPATATINGGSNQQFTITFQSNSAGTKTTKLVFLHNGPAQSDTVSVSATNSFVAQGTAGQMIQFDGVNDYLNNPDATHPTAYTIEAWVKFNTVSAQNIIVRTDASGPTSTFTHQLILNSGGKFAHYTFFGTSNTVIGTTTVVAGQWYHVAITAQNSGSMKLFVNGVEEGTAQSVSGTLWASGTRWMVGVTSNSYEGSAGYLNGSLDELRIWNTARSASQIQSSYASLAGNESNLSRYFRLDEGFGTTSGDGTGNGISTTLVNGASWAASTAPLGTPAYSTSSSNVVLGYVANGAARTDSVTISNTSNAILNITPSSNNVKLTFSPSTLAIVSGQSATLYFTFAPQIGSDSAGIVTLTHNASGSPSTISVKHLTSASFSKAATAGNALLFNYDQYSDYASTAYSGVLNPAGSFSYEAWVRSDSWTGGQYVVYSGDGYYTGIRIMRGSPGSWNAEIGTGGTPITLNANGLTNGTWYHLAVTYSGTTAKFYVNGVLRDTKTGTYNRNTSNPFYVGAAGAQWYSGFTGAIDEVRVWNTTRTQEQIFADMTNSLFGNESGLAAYWRFDEGSGTTVADLTGGGRNLTLGGTNYTPTWQSSAASFPAAYFNTYTTLLSYGNVQTAKTKKDSFYVKNFGAVNLSVSSVTSDNARYTIAPTSVTIATSDSGKFVVTFAPTAVQAENGTISLAHNAFGSPNSVSVSGTGATANYSSSTSSIAFGTVQVGVSKMDSVTITNSGTISLVIDSVRSSNSNYTISPTTATIAASGTQKFYITFASTTPTGAANGTISFYHSTTGSPGTVTVTGTKVQTAAANAGTALTFDGTNDYVSRAVVTTATNNISFDAWVKWDGQTASGNRMIVYNGSTGSSGYGLIIEGSSTPNNALSILNGGVGYARSTYVLTSNQWQHVAVVRESGTWKLYVDGVQQTLSGSTTAPNTPSGTFYVGSNVGGSEAFQGSIDEVRFWNTARTQTQIQSSYNSLAGNESGLIAYYRFDENNGTTAYDNSGTGNLAILNNGPVFASSTALIGTPAYSVSPSSKAFGSQQAGTAKVDSVTVTNTGGGLLNIGTITSGNAAYTITPSNVAVRPSSTQKFYIIFLAPSPAAAQNTTLSVPHNAAGSPSSISVTGTSVFQAASNAGNGLTFTGTSKFVDIASNAALSTSSFTIELWIKIGATWGWSGVIDKGRNTGNNWFILTTNSGAAQAQGVTFGMQGGTELVNIWGDANWHHIAATFDGSTQRLYVDGVLTGGFAGVSYTPTNDLIRIGGRQDTSVYSLNPFNGNMDEVRLWNTARTQSEIQQSYSSRLGNETGLVSYLRFDESSGTTAYDATGNGRNGTLVNGLTRMITSTATVGNPVYSTSSSSKNIGNIYLSNSRQDSVTISNTGNGVLNVTAISSNNAQFTVSPSTMDIVSGSSAKLYITALPTALGLQNGTITLTHNSAGSPSAISVSATAIVPVISSFTPSSGPSGTSVIISGSGFSSTPANNSVTFGATKGTVTASTDTTITVTVPTGATYAPITVTTNNLQAHSRNGFIVTFTTSNSIASGSFASNQSVTAPSSGYGMTFSDIDGDGKPDAVLGIQASNGLSILRNTGSSGTVSFASASNFASGSSGLDVATGDLDGDGKPDVIVTKQSSGFSIFRNTSTSGSVSFATRIDSALNVAHGAAIGDLDGDGKPELVIVNNSGPSVRIYKNTSTPGTITLTSVLSVTTGTGPREVHLIDFDGDGKLDIATNNFSGGSVSVLRNTSTVGSISFDAKLDLTGASSTFGIAVGDLTGDGKPEVVSGGSTSVKVYHNNSTSGSLSFAAAVTFSASADRTVTIGDFSGDGKPDIASNSTGGTISVLKNTYTSGSISASSFATKVDFTAGSGLWNLRSADLDGDGKIDLAAISQTGSSMSVLRNTVPLPATFNPNPSTVAFGSVNLGSNKTDSTWVKNTGGVALSITAAASTNAQYSVSPSTATVAIGDSQKFNVTFTPTQATAVSAKLVFTTNTAAASDTVSLSGTGIGPVLTLSASSKSFGSILVSANKKDSIYLKNTGNASLSVTNVVSDNAEFTVNSTTFSVNALDSAKLIITLTPTTSGTKTATIQITHNGQTSPTSLSVDGRGIQPIFTPSAANIAFGNVGYYQSKTDSLTVSNTGVDTLTITSVMKSNVVYTVTPTSATVLPSGSQKFYVTYIPVAVTTTNDTLTFTHNAGSATKIPLSGTGALLSASTAGNALDLNGTSQYADLADGVWFNGNFTVETWVYIRAVANYSRIIDFANGQSSNNIIITASEGTSGKIGLHIFNGAASTSIVTPNAVALNTWVHVACVFNSGTGKIYLNGTEVVSGGLNTPVNVTRTLNYIGRSQWSDPYVNMRMDEFRIWNVARTVTQIQSSMNSSLAGNESGLLAYLRFDESSGTTAVNFTASGSNAAMLSGASRAVSTISVPGANFISSKSTFVYGTIPLGSSTPDTLWVKNLGALSLQIDSARSSNDEFSILPASATVVSGDSVRFITTLTPLTSGSKSANITFYSNAYSTPNVFSASGTAISAEPTVRDSNAVVTKLLPYGITLKWKEGDGENHLVLIKSGSVVDGTPADATVYTANGIFGGGTQLGTGNYTVYSGSDDSVVISNLTAGTTYHVSVIGYNGTGSSVNYLLPSAATASFTVPYAVNSPLPGNALLFDGSGTKSMTIMSSTPTAYTVEMWIKLNSTGNQSIFSRTDAGGPIYSYSHALDIYGGYIRHYIYDGNSKSVLDGIAVTANTWYHVAIVAVNGGTMRLYVNGEEVGTPISVNTLWTDGDRYVAGYGGAGPFDGSMDELRIWSSERTALQIRENMHRRIGGAQTGLLSYFQFNEASGDAADSIKGTVGTLANSPSRQSSTIPFGNGTSASINTVQSGVHSVGSVSLNLTDGFDNNSDVTSTELSASPNVLPSGYSSLVGSKLLVISVYGSHGSYSTDLSIDFGSSVIDPRADSFPGGVKLFRRDVGSDGAWTMIGGAVSANSTTGVVTWSGISSLGQFSAVFEETALPVELVSFTAATQRLNTELKWKTATEVNNFGFEIQRSEARDQKSESGTWTKAGFVEGNGTSNTAHEYSFTDQNLKAGKYEYRLKQIDRDGDFGYSSMIEIVVGAAPQTFELAQNYPNPFNPTSTISFTLHTSGLTTLKVYDILGKEVATLIDENLEAGVYHQTTFDGARLSSGIYFARLTSGNKTQLKKMMMIK